MQLSVRGPGFASRGRSTPPPVHPHSHDRHDPHEHGRPRRPRGSSFPLVFALSIAFVAVGLVAALALVGRESPPTFGELKAQLGIAATGAAQPLELGQVEFVNRLDAIGASRQAESFEGAYLYLYYKVREGQAQIILDRGAWQAGRARIRQIALR